MDYFIEQYREFLARHLFHSSWIVESDTSLWWEPHIIKVSISHNKSGPWNLLMSSGYYRTATWLALWHFRITIPIFFWNANIWYMLIALRTFRRARGPPNGNICHFWSICRNPSPFGSVMGFEITICRNPSPSLPGLATSLKTLDISIIARDRPNRTGCFVYERYVQPRVYLPIINIDQHISIVNTFYHILFSWIPHGHFLWRWSRLSSDHKVSRCQRFLFTRRDFPRSATASFCHNRSLGDWNTQTGSILRWSLYHEIVRPLELHVLQKNVPDVSFSSYRFWLENSSSNSL